MNEMRIVVVEDDEDLRQLFTVVLSDLGHVVGFGDVYQALAHLRSDPCELLVLDHLMPGATGVDLLERLRRDGIDVPVLVVTAMVSAPLLERLRELGVRSTLAKPITADELLQAATAACNSSSAVELLQAATAALAEPACTEV